MARNKKYINRHRKWQAYATKELAHGRKPIKFKDYVAEALEPVYFKGITRPTIEAQLKAAGVDWKKDKPTAKFKRKKK